METPILLVAASGPDDTRQIVEILGPLDVAIEVVETRQSALDRLARGDVGLLVYDASAGGLGERGLFQELRELVPDLAVVVLLEAGEKQEAREAWKLGGAGCLFKPYQPEELLCLVQQGLRQVSLREENLRLKHHLSLMGEGVSLLAALDLVPMLESAVALGVRELAVGSGFAFVREREGFVLHGLHGLEPEKAQGLAQKLYPRLACDDGMLLLDRDSSRSLGCEQPLAAYSLCARQALQGGLVLLGPKGGIWDVEACVLLARQLSVAFENVSRLQGVQQLMYTDDLTGLYNYRYLQVVLEQELRRSGRYYLEFALVFMDLDYFKEINDRHGHLVGSAILREVGQVLRRCVRDTDFLFRYGGDEFTALLVGTEGKGARVVAERIRRELAEHHFLAERGINARLTATIGVSVFPQDSEDRTELLNLADRAMYWGKETRNVVRYARDMTDT
ncbi:GGDEF domain-containing protein [Geoalkalibacter halelectricus]|uniref:diguanylate cyclase n=1 Tax=Geoalkalibacter halelectricus TaxID=2847045 RepID=A0ABY5ZJ05_9BACT|nr:diguanylate cyclase [Geoalkalibacter halelectricus]MDO3376826.1 diguanylate cyclase [Geoalkalibacter halelectricus]UWZ79108.1 diguanylate cyclase [Geoalkalibacter halelectricus]